MCPSTGCLAHNDMSDLGSVRAEIKAWERSFKDKNSRDPTIQDIKQLPVIAQKYKLYKKLSKAATSTTVASTSSISRNNGPPSTPMRPTPKSTNLLQSPIRRIELTAPLESFNPFSPQKTKGKQKEAPPLTFPKPTSPNPFASSPRKSNRPSPPNSPPHPTSTQEARVQLSAVSRARKRLRGEPVSPSPNKEKRRRLLAQTTLPFPKLQLQDTKGGDSESEGGDEESEEADTIDDSPMKPVANGKTFTLLFEETVKSRSTSDLFGGESFSAKPQRNGKRSVKTALPSMDDDIFGNDRKPKKGSKSKPQPSALAKSRKLVQSILPLPSSNKGSNEIRKLSLPSDRSSTKRNAFELDGPESDLPNNPSSIPEPPTTELQLLPPSPNPNSIKPVYGSKAKAQSKANSRKKAKSRKQGDLDEGDASGSDSFDLQANVKLVHISRGIRAAVPTDEASSDGEDPILKHAWRSKPRGQGSESPTKAGVGRDQNEEGMDGNVIDEQANIEGHLPEVLHRVLTLETIKSKQNDYEEERIVKALLSGRRVVHYDPKKGGEIWGVGEDEKDEFNDDVDDTIVEEEEEWEGEPVPWEIGELDTNEEL